MRLGSKPFLLWTSSALSTVSAFRQFGSKSSATTSLFAFVTPRHTQSRFDRSQLRMSSSTLDNTSHPSTLRVALCQFPVTHHKDQNEQTAKSYLQQAKDQGAQLAVLPEIWNSPYATAAFPEYAEVLPDLGDSTAEHSSASQLLMVAAKEHNMWIIGGSIPERVEENGETIIYNTCLVLNPQGTVVAKHRKVHLFDIDVPGGITFFESETLTAGSTVSHFSTPFGEIGVGICYDIRFAEYAMVLRQKYNCVLLVYPGAFNMTTGPAHWELLQRARALDNQCFVVTASPARTTEENADKDSKYPHYTAWGHSTVVSPWGEIVATTDEMEGLVVADLDLSRIQQVRNGIPIGNQRRTDLYSLEEKQK
ncbi:amidohydrolase [Nitzschia inconspicua]|uniref:Amidohydrolase n=1 Tax=Nitzschia inconspicua TaxID=303405 RepID=A0A9K3LP84_9STRA|nr:amidohydrolase [Nitzschia inconspicua]